jgi:TetR/AcrR family transcriptional repressor of bet genes
VPERRTEALRRDDLVAATIHEIGAAGSLDVTVGQIARRAGVSPALAFHYFGGKDRLFLAAMRAILTVYGAEVRGALHTAQGPRARTEALIRASFAPSNFRREVVAAWLNFYVLAAADPAARRLLTIYQKRLRSNLVHGLRPLAGDRAEAAADRLAGLIDGLYLRAALDADGMTGEVAAAHVLAALERETGGAA